MLGADTDQDGLAGKDDEDAESMTAEEFKDIFGFDPEPSWLVYEQDADTLQSLTDTLVQDKVAQSFAQNN